VGHHVGQKGSSSESKPWSVAKTGRGKGNLLSKTRGGTGGAKVSDPANVGKNQLHGEGEKKEVEGAKTKGINANLRNI